MNDTDRPGRLELFEQERPRLTGLAYRITASIADAEDVVQETWLRWSAANQESIINPAGWLMTVASRIALDRFARAAPAPRDLRGAVAPGPGHD